MKFTLAATTLAVAVSMASAADIPTTAIENGSFSTLVAALTAADLVGAVSAAGPFTVFAPTDDAFAALPEGLVACLLLPANKDALTAILTYHVASGQVMSTDLTEGMAVTTLQGETAIITLADGVKVNTANVVIADVGTDNGVIHAIDAVITPPSIDVAAFLAACPAAEAAEAPAMEDTPTMEDTPKMEDTTMDDSGASALSAFAAVAGAGLVAALF